MRSTENFFNLTERKNAAFWTRQLSPSKKSVFRDSSDGMFKKARDSFVTTKKTVTWLASGIPGVKIFYDLFNTNNFLIIYVVCNFLEASFDPSIEKKLPSMPYGEVREHGYAPWQNNDRAAQKESKDRGTAPKRGRESCCLSSGRIDSVFQCRFSISQRRKNGYKNWLEYLSSTNLTLFIESPQTSADAEPMSTESVPFIPNLGPNGPIGSTGAFSYPDIKREQTSPPLQVPHSPVTSQQRIPQPQAGIPSPQYQPGLMIPSSSPLPCVAPQFPQTFQQHPLGALPNPYPQVQSLPSCNDFVDPAKGWNSQFQVNYKPFFN